MIEPCYPALGATIRAYRRSRGLSQQQLADCLGYERFSSISDLERGKIRLHVHQLQQLSDLFEVPVASLLFGASEESRCQAMMVEGEAWRGW